MVRVIVDIKNGQAINKVNKWVADIPKKLKEATWEFAKLNQKNLRFQISKRNNTKTIYNSILAKRWGKGARVVMSQYGIYLDRAKPHIVPIIRGSRIAKWAKTKGVKGFRLNQRGNEIVRGIMVNPHPFIDAAFTHSYRQLRPLLKRKFRFKDI